MNPQGHDLWAITSYFNPIGYKRRLANYHLFRQHLTLPLVTVEVSFFGAAFDLDEGNADILLRVRGGDVMWQKERLLNVALGALPSACRKVVWLDCDTIVGADDWAERVSQALEESRVVQAFSRAGHLMPDATEMNTPSAGDIEYWRPSVAFEISGGRSVEECFRRPTRSAVPATPGIMWAARRELPDECGFYDACIVGGGDLAMACAAYGCFEEALRRQAMNERQRQHYLVWAERYFKAVRGSVTYVDCPVFHLWHGAKPDRKYLQRHEGLRDFHFDPFLDVAVADSGAWRWNSDKPQLHGYVRDYLAGRKEDG